MSKPRFHHGKGNNHRTEVVTAFGVDEAVAAAKIINGRTRAFNYYHREDIRYKKDRAKITLPADITAWLNKEV